MSAFCKHISATIPQLPSNNEANDREKFVLLIYYPEQVQIVNDEQLLNSRSSKLEFCFRLIYKILPH